MFKLFKNVADSPRNNAMRNLRAVTNYVDFLRSRRSTVVYAKAQHGGLLFSIVDCARRVEGKPRVYGATIFDIFGDVVFFQLRFTSYTDALDALEWYIKIVNRKILLADTLRKSTLQFTSWVTTLNGVR